MSEQGTISYGTKEIEFVILRRQRKTLTIKVHPDGAVYVIAPAAAETEKILAKVKSKAAWILSQKKYFERFRPPTPARRFVNGETHLYLGRQYKLFVYRSKETRIKLSRGKLEIYSPKTNKEVLNQLLNQWYKQHAKSCFETTLRESIPLFSRYKIKTPRLQVRSMKKKWGSCTPEGKIILNTELIKTPKACIEYVVVHELCHLVHYNHTKKFFELQSRLMPDWEKWKEKLEMMLV